MPTNWDLLQAQRLRNADISGLAAARQGAAGGAGVPKMGVVPKTERPSSATFQSRNPGGTRYATPTPSPTPTGIPQAQLPFQRSGAYVRPNVQGQYPRAGTNMAPATNPQFGFDPNAGTAMIPQTNIGPTFGFDPNAGTAQIPNNQVNPMWDNMYHGSNPAGIPVTEPNRVNALTVGLNPNYNNSWPMMRSY